MRRASRIEVGDLIKPQDGWMIVEAIHIPADRMGKGTIRVRYFGADVHRGGFSFDVWPGDFITVSPGNHGVPG